MIKPTLIIMAAGMGNRYGGLKQIDPIGPGNEMIIDYSVYDALQAGFGKIVFVIKRDIEDQFREAVGKRIESVANVQYVFQSLDNLPEGFNVPDGRVKPWGTAHAVYCCKDAVGEPFAVINADDFYGRDAFVQVAGFLSSLDSGGKQHHCMAGYLIENTVSDNGHVARGVCELSGAPGGGYFLRSITERAHIQRTDGKIAFTEDGEHFIPIPEGTVVSMNMWGFDPRIMHEFEAQFRAFLKNAAGNIEKAEFFLPSAADELIQEGKADVRVLKTTSKWFGVTYKEDRKSVKDAIAQMVNDNLYPKRLWAK